MRLNAVQNDGSITYLVKTGIFNLFILAFILICIFVGVPFAIMGLSPFSLLSFIFYFFVAVTLYILITNAYQHLKYGGSRWAMIDREGIRITFTHYVEKDKFKWGEIERIFFTKKLISRGKFGKERYSSNALVFLIKNTYPEKQVFDLNSLKCAEDHVQPNMLHYSPESKEHYLVSLFLSDKIINDILNLIRMMSGTPQKLKETDLLKLDYKNRKIEIK